MRTRRSFGFVTLDVLWILILLGLVIVLSMRGIGLVEKRDVAERLERELEVIAEAVEEAAAVGDLMPGEEVEFSQYAAYLDKKAPKRLREDGRDQLGGKFGVQVVGELPVPDAATVRQLGAFWEGRSED
ncbi:MAG: hypothetical protein ACI8XO_003959 [Verrucomicrobiales bacterium]|jgi:hypothetical protein